jgi:hypothetical protein
MAAVMPKAPSQQELQLNINPNNYETKIPSLNQVQSEFGLQDPSKYADQISKANAQPQLDNLAAQRDLVDQGLREGQQALEVDYFQQYRNQREENALRGLNAGIESQRTNLLQMNQGQQMTKLLQDANREKQNIKRAEATVEVQRQAQALELRNNELQRQIDMAFRKGDFLQAENARRMQMDIEKEQTRIQNVQYMYNTQLDNYWGTLENESRQRMEALEKQKVGIQSRQADNQARMAQLQYQLDQQRVANDRWYKQQSLNSAAADRAAAAASKKAENTQNELMKQRQIDSVVADIKRGQVNPAEGQEILLQAYNNGVFKDRDTDYRAAVVAANQASSRWEWNKKENKWVY